MRSLSPLIIAVILCVQIFAQSPHGSSLKQDCSDCHVSSTWKVSGTVKFNHAQTGFPLTGQHKILSCRTCHTTLVFSETKQDCFSCHKDIHQNSVGFNCLKCHTTDSWVIKDMNNLHRETRFPLTGRHQQADCIQCHTGYNNLVFQPQDVNCFACHKNDYSSAKNPDHVLANFKTDCRECHNMNSPTWASGTFSHDFFPLTGMHKISNCFACHTGNQFKGIKNNCYSCHQKDFTAVKDPDHVAGNFSQNCLECHSTEQPFKFSSFDHNATAFKLTGAHINTDCKSCHTTGYKGTSTQCASCHQKDYDVTTDPNHKILSFSTDCSTCHNINPGWTGAKFEHDAPYFPIYSGKHLGQWNKCSDCHLTSSNYKDFSCTNCHAHNKTETDAQHTAISGYVYATQQCFSCHPKGTSEGSFNHATSAFPLTGAHINVSCSQCHQQGYANTPTQCFSCHQNNFNGAINPNHKTLALNTDCSICHSTTSGWKPAQFPDHNKYYQFVGSHISIASDCAKCHNGNYNSTPNTCYGCHKTNYDNTLNPNHKGAGFNTECQTCHTQSVWKPATFAHDAQYFPIYSGKHSGKWNVCSDCHTNSSNYQEFSCINCHAHNKTETDGQHSSVSGYIYASQQCFSCHPKGSSEGSFNHSTSVFPLTGAHLNVSCSQCHQQGYANTPTECVSCHQNNFNATTNPSHLNLQLSSDCKLCHTTNIGWKPASFPVHNVYYELTGAHSAISSNCVTCHNGNFKQISTECVSCHQSNYDAAANPNHKNAGMSLDCKSCHNNTAWIPSTFSHSNTQFPLTGIHITTNCESCHKTTYKGTPVSCVSCHQANYDGSVNPNHKTLGLSNDCTTCHTTNAGWKTAIFPVHSNYYQLAGAHISVSCITCHNGSYNNTPTTCYGCHSSNFNNATNPNHVAPGFSHECLTCHTQSVWTPSTFVHDNYFPVYSGKHKGRWTTCSQCHPSNTDYTQFTCTTSCHPKANMDNEHQGRAGYTYTSSACLNCHPRGNTKIKTGWPKSNSDI